MRHSSLSLRERSQGEEWLSGATHSFPWVTLACVTHREWGFGEARTGVSEPRSLEVFAHFAEEKLRPGRGYLVGLPQQIRHKEPRTPVSCSGLCPMNQGHPGWDQCGGWKERDRTWL